MKKLLLTLVCLFALPASAEDVVSVIWRRQELHPDGRKVLVQPPESYVQLVRSCGGEVRNVQRDSFPVKSLLCNGILDFSQSATHKATVEKILNSLIQNKFNWIGSVSIADIRAKMGSIRLGVSPWGVFEAAVSPSSTEAARHAAINIASEKLVILNSPLWKYTSPEFRDLLLLHEVFGASGFDDEHYELTLTAWWLSRHPERIPFYRQKPPSPASLLEEAGVSVVGHGGDFSQIQFKASLLEATVRNLQITGANNQPIPARFLPSKLEEEQAIFKALIFSQSTQHMMQAGLCAGPQGPSIYHCGGFLLKGKTGEPFMVMSKEWGTYPSNDQRWPLVLKVYQDILKGLVCSKGYPCQN